MDRPKLFEFDIRMRQQVREQVLQDESNLVGHSTGTGIFRVVCRDQRIAEMAVKDKVKLYDGEIIAVREIPLHLILDVNYVYCAGWEMAKQEKFEEWKPR